MEYKKAMLGGIMKSTKTFDTKIQGQKGYKQSFEEKNKEQIKNKKDFLWIYKG
jgi:hypothetical protein